jgi:hypothetical protein
MTMPSRLRKSVLAVHLTCSVGWTGAAAAYLVLVVVALTDRDGGSVRDAILVMESIDRFVIVPTALAALLTGLILSLGTPWGLFRHYWVVFTLLLTVFAVFVLMEYSQTLSRMASSAARPGLSGAELAVLRDPGHAVHTIGGLVLLLVVTALNVYKPRGMTRYGWRRQQERRATSVP